MLQSYIYIETTIEFATKLYKKAYSSLNNCNDLEFCYINGYDILNNFDNHKNIEFEGVYILIDIKNKLVSIRKAWLKADTLTGTLKCTPSKSKAIFLQFDNNYNIIKRYTIANRVDSSATNR